MLKQVVASFSSFVYLANNLIWKNRSCPYFDNCMKEGNVQLSSNLCQYIWKHTNRMPDTGPGCRIRMPDSVCMEIALNGLSRNAQRRVFVDCAALRFIMLDRDKNEVTYFI